MSTHTLQGLTLRKDMGLTDLKKEDWPKAVDDFTIVVENLRAENDQLAAMKMLCFNGRAQALIQLNRLDEAMDDTVHVIDLFELMRPRQLEQKRIRKNDPLKTHLHVAFARRGQVLSLQSDVPGALNAWDKAMEIWPAGEARDLKEQFLFAHGIPNVDMKDESLKPFSLAFTALKSDEAMIHAFHEIVTYLNKNQMSKEQALALDKKHIGQLMLGVLNFFMQNTQIVDIGLTLAWYLLRRGAEGVWQNHEVIGKVMSEYQDNSELMQDVLQFLSVVPKNLYDFFGRKEYLEIYMKMFEIEQIPEESTNCLFILLFHVLKSEDGSLPYMMQTNILEYVFKRKTMGAMLLLARLMKVKELCVDVRTSGEAAAWFSEVLNDDKSREEFLEPCMIAITCLLATPLTEEENPDSLHDIAAEYLRASCSLIKQNAKNLTIVRDLIDLAKVCLPHAPDVMKEINIIQVASMLLALNLKTDYFAFSVIEFLYMCTEHGLVEEIKKVPQALPNVMKALEQYANYPRICERCIGFAVRLDHPNKEMLLQAGIKKYPQSQFLKQFIGILDVSAIVQQVTGGTSA